MSYWPEPCLIPTHQLTVSVYSAAGAFSTIGRTGAASVDFGGANSCFAWPIRLTRPATYRTAWWMNGASLFGSAIVGIYGAPPGNPTDSQPVKLAETAQVVLSGANAIQSTSIGPTYLRPGLYYIAMIVSNASATMFLAGGATTAQEDRHIGLWQIAQGSFALPATLGTPTSPSNTHDVLFGLATQTVI